MNYQIEGNSGYFSLTLRFCLCADLGFDHDLSAIVHLCVSFAFAPSACPPGYTQMLESKDISLNLCLMSA